MKNILSRFFDRLAERLTGLLASLISSRFQTLQAVDLAEQQSELEEHARRYEQEGKPAIAAAMRERIEGLASTNLAIRGGQIIDSVAEVPPRLVDANPTPADSAFPDPSLLAPPKATREAKAADCTSKRKPTGGHA